MLRSVALLCLTAVLAINADATGYYTIAASDQIHQYSNYDVSVNVHEASEPSTIKLTIQNGDNFKMSQDVTVQPFSTEQVTFKTEQLPPSAEGGYKLIAEGKISGVEFHNESTISLNEKQFSTLIQTDKAIYKPGDKIQFRIIVLDPKMNPLKLDGELHAHIIDGKGNRLKQWSNESVSNGVFSNELQLSDVPVLGDWTIVVDVLGETKKKTVEVAEYVLPKVEVKIETPKDLTFKDPVRAIIRAKYTYGKPVRGEATVKLQKKSWGFVEPNELIAQKVVKLNGKGYAEFDLEKDLNLTKSDYYRELTIFADVTEDLTGRHYNATDSIIVRQSAFYVLNVNNAYSFTPEKPYEMKIRIVRHDGKPIDEAERSVFVNVTEGEKEFLTETIPLDKEGYAVFTTTFPTNSSYLISIKYQGHTEQVNYLYPTDETSAMQMSFNSKCLTEKPIVSEPVEVEVNSPDPMPYLTYIALGSGKILNTGTVKFDAPVSKHVLKLETTREMLPMINLVVYYLQDGEMVSNYLDIPLAEDPKNKISLKTSVDEAKPGESVDLLVNAQPGSFVGLLGIDQSVLLLKSGNDLKQDEIDEERNAYKHDYQPSKSEGGFFRGHYPHYSPSTRDFSSAGTVLMTNMKMKPIIYALAYDSFAEEREVLVLNDMVDVAQSLGPTSAGPKIRKEFPETWIWDARAIDRRPVADGVLLKGHTIVLALASGAGGSAQSAEVKVRKEFPETWIWDEVTEQGSDGSMKITKKVPDTITSWVISAFSLNPQTGISLTQDPSKLKVFQPFFVSLNLPYSIKRGEVVAIPIVVFNYMDAALDAEVTLHNEDQAFEFVEITNDISENPKIEPKRSKTVAIKANDGSAVSFMIKPVKVGPITIKVTAVSPLAGDGVERVLPVEPEGVAKYFNKALFVDLRETNELDNKLTIKIPDNAVPDSARIEVSAIGDILGSTIKNLDSLIRMPYGCGEQNMLNFVPNIVVINYLKNINQLTEDIKTRAVKYMESGYQRELTYKHKDGSFSAFGESDKNGSTWLTAFVARSFRQAAEHIDVEEKVIDDSLKWLSGVQAENGSFPEVGNVAHSDMQGGAGHGVALTAYTLIAFLENKSLIPTYQTTIDKALDYVVKNAVSQDDIYTLALAAYALQLADHSAKDEILEKFDSKATVSEGQKYWNKPVAEVETTNGWQSKPNSVNTEMSAYGLLTLIVAKPYTEVIPIMKWLLAQRNDQGGFQSTQDTVLGIQALAKIAEKIAVADNALDIKLNYGESGESNIKVNKDNNLIYQQYEIPKESEEVKIHATGHGFALVQLSYKYHVNDKEESPRFTITPVVEPASSPNVLELKVCTSYVPTSDSAKSNMAVMEVEFPSGFTADSDAIPDLESSENVKKVETKNGDTTVIVYFDNISDKELCPTFVAIRTHKVAKQKPASIAVYDYYDTTRRADTFYNIEETSLCDICDGDDCKESCPK